MTSIHHSEARRHRGGRSALLVLLAALTALVGAVLLPSPTHAVPAVGTGVGFTAPDGWWIGSWSLADGAHGFCIDLGGRAPTGHDLHYVDAAALERFSVDDRARLAYISRTWGPTDDPVTAAAAQLATWTITGLNGHSMEELAQRAGAHAGEVLNEAHRMLGELSGPSGASRSVAARLTIDRNDVGESTLVAQLDVDFVAGSAEVAPDSFDGIVTVQGAVFADGSHQRRVRNGVANPLTPDDSRAVMSLAASATFADLPFGAAATIAHAEPGVQSVLTASPARASAGAEVAAQRPSSLPFQPAVTTKSSDSVAAAGATVHDVLQVGVGTVAGASAQWGVYGDDGGPYAPIPVTVRSRLLGPFDTQPALADEAPADAPVVCEVTTKADHGPGEYSTPTCTLPQAGYYVWTESISRDDTPPERGRARVLPWTSRFGEAAETVLVQAPAAPAPDEVGELAETGSGNGPQQAATALAATSGLLFGISALCVRWARRRARRGETAVRVSRSARS